MNINWSVQIGNGVIDCSLSESGAIVAGDINGDVIVTNLKGEIREKWNVGMPIWGVDICKNGKYVAIAAADKINSRGAFFVYKDGLQILEQQNISEVWDVIIHDSENFFFSTWRDGLIYYNITTEKVKHIHFETSLFGLSINKDVLYVTLAEKGIQLINLRDHTLKTIKSSSFACFNNLCDDYENIFSGSNGNFLVNHKGGKVQRYYVGSGKVCSVSILDNYILVGDLDGYLYVLTRKNPNIPVFRYRFPGGLWNIETNHDNVIIACGDGTLYLVNYDEIKRCVVAYGKKFIQSDETLELLKGTKVFLSYSRKDKEKVNLIYQSLKDIGCIPWMDVYDILPGQDWKLEVQKTIQDSQFVMIFLSKNSTTSKGYFQKEIQEAFEEFQQIPKNQIFLIPVKLDECDIPQEISRLQFVELFTNESFERILGAMYHQILKTEN